MSKEESAAEQNARAAEVSDMFTHFCSAASMRQILGLYWNMCDTIGIRPGPLNEFYPKLKANICCWKSQTLWRKLDARAEQRVYNAGKAASKSRVLIIGAGPCGLRTAIEAQLLGAKVVVVEKRDRISRNNVLHLWPFVIHDLKMLGAKKFYGKFCAGSIDHISIRQLQCILLKVALLLGVEVHEGVSFVKEIEPADGYGWRAAVQPEEHAVSHYEFDVLIGANGKRTTFEGFQHQEMRGKLAIAITVNFVNRKTEAEVMAQEISGVTYIFNQSFFKELYEKTGIDLENIVYYKDDTHYFVMTAKKHSLLQRGVIKQDYAQPVELLAQANVNKQMLYEYARDAAYFATKYQIPKLEFAVNHYGQPDVCMFDFTSMYNARNSCKVTVRKNYRLLTCLVGDSLMEPFWPTGSGCAYGFLSSMDAAYAIKMFANPSNSLLATIALRESVFRLLPNIKSELMHNMLDAYTIDPSTRYRNLNKFAVTTEQARSLLDTDDPTLLEQTSFDPNTLLANTTPEVPAKRKRRTAESMSIGATLLHWLKSQLKDTAFVQELAEPAQCFTNGKVLCTLIHRYRPDLVNLDELTDFDADACNELAFMIFHDHLGIPRVMSGQESVSLSGVDQKVWLNYLEQICDVFRGEIPHVKHLKLDYAEFKQQHQKLQTSDALAWANLGRYAGAARATTAAQASSNVGGSTDPNDPGVPLTVALRKPSHYLLNVEEERFKRTRGAAERSPQNNPSKRAKKRRQYDKSDNIAERTRRLQEIDANRLDRQTKRSLQRAQQTQDFYKSIEMQQANALLGEDENSSAFEDYSLFLYRQSAPVFNDRVRELELKLRYPDRERDLAAAYPRGITDGVDQFSDRVRSMEQRIGGKTTPLTDKKPKDLLRAIGKIDSNDWNVKEIERKIEQSKKATDIGKSRERVPNWNREQFLARQNRLAQPQDEERYREIDSSLKAIDKQLKEGHNLDLGERGKNKVAQLAGQLQSFKQRHQSQQQQAQKSNPKALLLTASGVAEKCHFCKQRVYLMEKISAEGLTLHRSCLKCHHCHTNLRLGGYAFDRDAPQGRFYCTPHFKLPSKMPRPAVRKSHPKGSRASGSIVGRVIDPSQASGSTAVMVDGTVRPMLVDTDASMVDHLDRDARTPERVSDDEANMEEIDENEWTDRNFCTESGESDKELSSSDESETDSDSEYGETAGSPLGAQTLQLAAEWISDKRFSNMVDSDADFYSYSSEDDEADSQTEGEELARAREMRRQEVNVLPPPTLPTDTETEVFSSTNPTGSLLAEDYSKHDDVGRVAISNDPGKSSSSAVNTKEQSQHLTEPCSSGRPAPESAEERAFKERMLQKLSVREQWLHAQAATERNETPENAPSTAGGSGACGGIAGDTGSKSKSTSFFGGLMSSLSILIKPKAPNSPPPSTTSTTVPTTTTSTTTSTRQMSHSLASPSPTALASLPLPVPKSIATTSTPRNTLENASPVAASTGAGRQSKPVQRSQSSAASVPIPPSPVPSVKLFAKSNATDALSLAASAVPPSPTLSLKKHRKPSKASASPSRGSESELEWLIQEASGGPLSSCGSQCSSPALSARSRRKEVVESSRASVEAEEFIRRIKEKQAESDKRSKLQQAKQFKNNMQSIRTAFDGGPKVVGVKSEKDVARFFANPPGQPQQSSSRLKQLSNKDVTALQGTANNLAKYFSGKTSSTAGTPTSLSSVEGSPALGRKKPSETDLLKYFGPGGGLKPNTLSSTPPLSLVSPSISRKSSIESPLPVRKSSTPNAMLPISPVAPLPPKKNILAFQSIKKSKTDVNVALLEPRINMVAKPPTNQQKQPVSTLSVDDQMFEDLLQDVDDTLVEKFDAILGEPKSNKSSPKATRKPNTKSPNGSALQARKSSNGGTEKANERYFNGTAGKQESTASSVPKMTTKRPPFKIAIPVKMQETLEEIYLASLSKLDTRSSSLIDLTDLGIAVEAVESGGNGQDTQVSRKQLGRVNEEPEGEARSRNLNSPEITANSIGAATSRDGSSNKLTLQPFQQPPQQKTTTATATKTTSNQEAKEPKASIPRAAQSMATPKKKKKSSVTEEAQSSLAKAPENVNGPSRAVTATPIAKKIGTTVQRKNAIPVPTKKAVSSVQISLKQSPPTSHSATEQSDKQQLHGSSLVQTASSTNKSEQAPAAAAMDKTNQSFAQTQINCIPNQMNVAVKKTVAPQRDTAPKSAFAVVSQEAPGQKSISMLELLRTNAVTKVNEKSSVPTPATVAGKDIASPAMNRKQRPVSEAITHSKVAQSGEALKSTTSGAGKGEDADSVAPPPSSSCLATTEFVKEPQSVPREISSDEKCFEELRRRHEALFARQEHQNNPSSPVPKTLSEARSVLVHTNSPPNPKPSESPSDADVTKAIETVAPQYRDGINQLMMELMPGTSIEQMLLDDLPIPKQRQKSSFQKEFNKLQRANSIATSGFSKNVPKANDVPIQNKCITKPAERSTPITTSSIAAPINTVGRLGSEEKMQIRLERSAQIKEQYAVGKSSLAQMSSSVLTGAEKQPFAMANIPVDIDERQSILSPAMNPKKPQQHPTRLDQQEVSDFEELLEKNGENSASLADVDLDELLLDVYEQKESKQKQTMKKMEPVKPSQQVVSDIQTAPRHMMDGKAESQAPGDVRTANNIKSQHIASTPSVQSARKEEEKSTFTNSQASNVKHSSIENQLSNNEFNVAVSQLTEKFTLSRKSSKDVSKESDQTEKDVKAKGMQNVEEKGTTVAPQTKLDVLHELCTKLEKKKASDTSSDLITSSTELLTEPGRLMPDVISSTEKQPQPSPNNVPIAAPLKILSCMGALKDAAAVVSQEIQVYTLHTTTTEESPQTQPSTQGMSGNYAHILKDITSGLVGADFAAPVVYEPPTREIIQQERSDFQAYKQQLAEKASREKQVPSDGNFPLNIATDQHPQRPLRRQKKVDHTESTPPATATTARATVPEVSAVRAFDNSICIDPWRARKSASIENIAIEQVFVKQNEEVVDTFFVVPDPAENTHEDGRRRGSTKVRRSKSYDRLAVPGSSGGHRRGSLKQKFEDLRDYDYDVEQPARSRNMVDPRLRHLDLDQFGSDEELSSLRDQPAGRWRGSGTVSSKFRKNKSMTDVVRSGRKETFGVEPPKVDIDRESPRPRTTDFSKWEAILDRGVTYYEGGTKPKADIKSLEKRIEDLDVRRARPLRRKAIPKDYDPEEYVPRINRRGAELCDVDPTLPRGYDPEEYIPKPNRGPMMLHSPPVQPLPRSYDPEEYIPKANRREPVFHEVPVAIQRAPAKYLKDPPYHYPQHHPVDESAYYGGAVGTSAPLGRSKTTAHVPVSSRAAYDLPARDIARSQYSRRYDADDRHIVDRSHRLHEKTNKYIRTQLTRNDPNPYIREMLEHDSDDEEGHMGGHMGVYPEASSVGSASYHPQPYHRAGAMPSSSGASGGYSYGTGSTYGTSGAAAMSRIQTKAITQPSRMLQYNSRGKDYPMTTSSATGSNVGARLSYDHRRRGDNSRTRENCNIS